MSTTTTPKTTQKLRLGRVGEATQRHDGIPKVTGEFAYSSDLEAAGMLWGQTVRSPHAHAQDRRARHLRGRPHARRPRGAHPRRRAGREDLRARVLRPAGARERPRPLLRRAGRARRGRGAGAGAPGRRRRQGRVPAARAGRSTWSERPSRSRSTRTGRRWRTAIATTRARTSSGTSSSATATPTPPGDVTVTGVYDVGIQDQAFLGPESGLAVPDGEGGVDIYVATQWLHVDRDQVAPCLDLPTDMVRIHLARRRRRVRRARGPLDADPRRHARAAHEAAR